MTSIWRVWTSVGYGAFEYVGEAPGDTFQDACRVMADANAAFAADFDPVAMTYQGCPLIPLDSRIEGRRVQFGGARDGAPEGP